MSTNYPAATDDNTTLPSVTGTTATNNPSHSGLHNNAADAIKALENKVGTGASVPGVGKVLTGNGSGSVWQAPTLIPDPSKAPLASPNFTGNPTAPTPATGDNSTSLATTAYVITAILQAAASYDKVIEYDNQAAFPATGQANTLYVARDTGLIYRWGGTQYTAVGGGTVPDATTTSKGILQLAGDLAGTAAAPKVASFGGVTVPSSAPVIGTVLTATSSTGAAWQAPTGGAGRSVTKTVGPSNADYITTGTADEQQILAAWNYVAALGGGTVHVQPGTFNFASAPVLLGSNMTLEGEGYATIFKQNANVNTETVCYGDATTAMSNVIFRNFSIDGNKANQPTNSDGTAGRERVGLRLRNDAQNVYYVLVENVNAYNTRQNGISVESTNYCTVRNCRSTGNDNFGIWWENGSQVDLIGNFTENNTLGGTKLYSCGSGNVIACQSKSDDGFSFGGYQIGSINWIACTSYRSGWHGAAAATAADGFAFSACSDMNFFACTVFGSGANGLELNGCYKNNFDGMTFKRCGQYANNTYSDILLTNAGGGSNCHDNNFDNITFENDNPQYYTNQAKYNISANSGGGTHNRNYFGKINYGTPATAKIFNLANNDGTPGAQDNMFAPSYGINPSTYYSLGSLGSSVTLDPANGAFQVGTGYYSSTNVTVANGTFRGQTFVVKLNQDVGNKQLVFDATVAPSGGFPPVFSGIPYSNDLMTFEWDGAKWHMQTTAIGPHSKQYGYFSASQSIDPNVDGSVIFGTGYSSVTTLSIANGRNVGQTFRLIFAQDVGNKSITFGGSNVKVVGGGTIIFSGVANTSDAVDFTWDGSNWYAAIALNPAQLAQKAPLASPALTGTPTAPTASAGTNTTQLATTAFVAAAIVAAASTYDDVQEASTYSALPATGQTGYIYITDDTGFLYRWSGSAYVQVGGGTPADATTTSKGIVQLTNDLGGTATAPTTPTAVHKTGNETAGGNKTWTGNQNISKSVPELRWTSADNDYSRLTRADSGNVMDLYNQTLQAAGNALAVNGTSSYAQMTWLSIGTTVGYDLWFTLASGTRTQGKIISYGSSSILADLTQIGWQPNIFGSAVYTAQTLTAGTKYHLVVTQTGTTYNMWLNGTQIVTNGTASAVNDSNNGQSRLGTYNGSDGATVTLDEVAIYSRALTATDVSTSYNSGNGLYHTTATNLVHIFHLDEGTGLQTIDMGTAGGYAFFSGTSPTWATSLIADPATTMESTLIESVNGVEGHTAGIHRYGDNNSTTIIRGRDVRFFTADGTERMRMDANGNFGFGTTAPTAPFTASSAAFTAPAASNKVPLNVTQNDTTNNPNAITIQNNGTGTTIYGRSPTAAMLDLRQTSSTNGTLATFSDSSNSTAGDGRVIDIIAYRTAGQAVRVSSGSASAGADLIQVNNSGTGYSVNVQGGRSLFNGAFAATQSVQHGVATTLTGAATLTGGSSVLYQPCNGTFTVTLAATTTAGYEFMIINIGSGTITVAATSFNGVAGNYTVAAGKGVRVVSTTTSGAWLIVGVV